MNKLKFKYSVLFVVFRYLFTFTMEKVSDYVLAARGTHNHPIHYRNTIQ